MNTGYLRTESLMGRVWRIVLVFSCGIAIGSQDVSADLTATQDTLRLIKNIARTIEKETVSPSSNERRVGSYGTVSQLAVRKLIFQLAALGRTYADDIYGQAEAEDCPSSRALIISLGLMKDARVHDDLREIVRIETDPNLRAMAVRALSTYMDTLDVPIFAEAVSDTNVVVMETDVATREGKFHELVNMVGMEAVPALYELGYKPVPDSITGGYKAVKIEK